MKLFFKNSLIFIAVTIAGLIVLESYFQTIEFELPYFELNDKVGKKMLPGKRITYFEEGFYLGATNKYGYLGPAYPLEKSKDKIRIALIGDSYAEGFHVFDSFHFSRILERRLNKDYKEPKFEVLNFGVGNYNYNDMIILYKNYISQFNPDILLFLVQDEDFIFRKNFIPSPLLKTVNDSLTIDYSFINSGVYKSYKNYSFFFNNSALMYAANNAYKIALRKDELEMILFDKLYTFFKGLKSKNVNGKNVKIKEPPDYADARIEQSFKWINNKTCFFIFRSDVPDYFKSEVERNGIKTAFVNPVLKDSLSKKGIDYQYWDITHLRGHWNLQAQKIVADFMYHVITSAEAKHDQLPMP